MIIDARKRYRESPHGKQWQNAVDSEWFIEGLLAGFATATLAGQNAADMSQAAATNYRIEGARQLLVTLLNLCETAPDPKGPSMPPNLRPTK